MEPNDIFNKNLTLLSKIKVGDTLSKVGENLVIINHNSWTTCLLRTFYTKESREDTYNYIKHIIDTVIYKGMYVNTGVREGLFNLTETYKKDPLFKEKLLNLINVLEKRYADILTAPTNSTAAIEIQRHNSKQNSKQNSRSNSLPDTIQSAPISINKSKFVYNHESEDDEYFFDARSLFDKLDEDLMNNS
jgi:hypothetical protein